MSVKVNNVGCYAYIIKNYQSFYYTYRITLILDNGRSDPDFGHFCQLLDIINFFVALNNKNTSSAM